MGPIASSGLMFYCLGNVCHGWAVAVCVKAAEQGPVALNSAY